VTIPRRGSVLEAKRFANRNLGWLEKQLLRQATRPAAPKIWTAGTEILFRGEKVPLQVTEHQRTAVVSFAGEVVYLTTQTEGPVQDAFLRHLSIQTEGLSDNRHERLSIQTEGLSHTSSGQRPGIISHTLPQQAESLPHKRRPAIHLNLRSLIEKHLWQLASRELPPRLAELAKQHGFQVRRASVRNQRSRWGSCSKRGTISLNWRLVQTPMFVRDYIILHELAHLKEMNHSRRFWREVARLCPDFARAERWLKDHAGLFR
jgi:predicted metal-dependent hydrolase